MDPLLLAVLGPTASGKSALALRLAEENSGEVVNCDAMQMIRYLEVGTAKPSREERLRVPHHLYDIVDPDERYSAGRYVVDARRVCREITSRENLPIIVGGTGLYLRVLLDGIFAGPARSEEIRTRLRNIAARKGAAYLHRILERRDPEAALKIEENDLIRLVRALEVWFVTGEPISALHGQREPLEGYSVLKLGLDMPREDLYDRINRRVERMFESGLLEEVEALIERGYRPAAKGFEAIGYRYAVAVLRDEIREAEAIELTQRDTRRYAKRQLTWFRKEDDVKWISGPGESLEAAEAAMALLGGMVE